MPGEASGQRPGTPGTGRERGDGRENSFPLRQGAANPNGVHVLGPLRAGKGGSFTGRGPLKKGPGALRGPRGERAEGVSESTSDGAGKGRAGGRTPSSTWERAVSARRVPAPGTHLRGRGARSPHGAPSARVCPAAFLATVGRSLRSIPGPVPAPPALFPSPSPALTGRSRSAAAAAAGRLR